MQFNENLRSYIFWIQDALNGFLVKRHYQDIKFAMEKGVAFKLDKQLDQLLEHAILTTQFYSKFDYKGGVNNFPVIDKNLIRENIDAFLSNQFSAKERIAVVTSGSTGTPFKTYQHIDKKKRNIADTIYFASLAGYNLGNKLYYFKIWSEYNKKSTLLQKIQNIVPIDVLNLETQAKYIIDKLNRNPTPISFLGYVSAFETLCKFLEKENKLSPHIKVASIITMSEGLNEYTSKMGSHFFNCPLLSRYSNIENGILAQQTLDRPDVFLINRASYFVEIMDLNSSEVLSYGNLGRIVVTDFYNKAMPLIRYDTGDLGIMDLTFINGVEQQILTKIEGRKLDQIYNTKGDLISPYIVYKNMWNYTEIQQYQFVQKNKNKYVFRISMEGEFKREKQLKDEFLKYLGNDADFSIEYVNEIPLLASGKRRKVVNEWKNM
jgi:phenylacetate-CoA ligase